MNSDNRDGEDLKKNQANSPHPCEYEERYTYHNNKHACVRESSPSFWINSCILYTRKLDHTRNSEDVWPETNVDRIRFRFGIEEKFIKRLTSSVPVSNKVTTSLMEEQLISTGFLNTATSFLVEDEGAVLAFFAFSGFNWARIFSVTKGRGKN